MNNNWLRELMTAIDHSPRTDAGMADGNNTQRTPISDFASDPSYATAASGSGKTRISRGFLRQVARTIATGRAPVAPIFVDGKGETANFLLR